MLPFVIIPHLRVCAHLSLVNTHKLNHPMALCYVVCASS